MQTNNKLDLEKIIPLISEKRLEAYGSQNSLFIGPSVKSAIQQLSNHDLNMRLSKSLYPLLQGIEIGLRNRLHHAISGHLKDNDWLSKKGILKQQEEKQIEDIRTKNKGFFLESHKLIAKLPFGFWTNLLDKRYETVFWPALLESTFPFVPRKMRTRKKIADRFNTIRQLRNRIFHHQKIYHLDLQENHRQLLDAIHWLEPGFLAWIKMHDEFPTLFAAGQTCPTSTKKREIV